MAIMNAIWEPRRNAGGGQSHLEWPNAKWPRCLLLAFHF